MDNEHLTQRQKKYVELRLQGLDPWDAAKTLGYKNTAQTATTNESLPKIITALSAAKARQMLQPASMSVPAVQVPIVPQTVPSAPVPAANQPIDLRNTWAPQPIPLVTPLSRSELVSALTNVVRDLDQPLQSRILASKLLCDLSGWLDPSKRQGDVFIRLGEEEKNL